MNSEGKSTLAYQRLQSMWHEMSELYKLNICIIFWNSNLNFTFYVDIIFLWNLTIAIKFCMSPWLSGYARRPVCVKFFPGGPGFDFRSNQSESKISDMHRANQALHPFVGR